MFCDLRNLNSGLCPRCCYNYRTVSPSSTWAAVDVTHCVVVPHRPAIEEVGAGGEEEEGEGEEVGREGTGVTETATETTARERWDSIYVHM